MTGTEIQILAETYLDGEDINDADALAWINDFFQMNDLMDVFRKTGNQDITVADIETWNSRTSGHYNIIKIVNDEGEEYKDEVELNHDGTQIRLNTAGTYTITSLIKPTELSALSETPDTNTIFHRPCAKFVAGNYKLKDDDTNKDGLRLIADGIQETINAGVVLATTDRRQYQRIKGRSWR